MKQDLVEKPAYDTSGMIQKTQDTKNCSADGCDTGPDDIV